MDETLIDRVEYDDDHREAKIFLKNGEAIKAKACFIDYDEIEIQVEYNK